MKKEIFIVINNFVGGPGFVSNELVKILSKKYKVKLLCLSSKGNLFFDELMNNPLVNYSFGRKDVFKDFFLIFMSSIFNIFKKERVNFYLISFDNRANIYSFLLKIISGIDWTVTFHGLNSPFYLRNKLINNLILRKANRGVANSNALKNKISESYKFLKVTAIPLGIRKRKKNISNRELNFLKTDNNNIIRLIHLANFYSECKAQEF